MKTRLSRRFVRKFGATPIYGAPQWATHLLISRWRELDMRASLASQYLESPPQVIILDMSEFS